MNSSEIKIYQVEGGQTEIEVKLRDETVWLSQKQMAELFNKDVDTIGLHLKNIYKRVYIPVENWFFVTFGENI